MFKFALATLVMMGTAEAEPMTCDGLKQQVPQSQVQVTADAGGQHYVFSISVDGVPLDEPKPKPKQPLVKTACDFIS